MGQNLLKLSLAISILGIFILLLLSAFTKPEPVSFYQQLKENKFVKVTGKVIYIKEYGDFTIARIDKNISLSCNCKLKQNQTIQVSGKVEKYQESLQINAERIEYPD